MFVFMRRTGQTAAAEEERTKMGRRFGTWYLGTATTRTHWIFDRLTRFRRTDF